MREIKFDVIVCLSKFSTTEHKTLEEALFSEDVIIRGGVLIPSREVYIREWTGLKAKNGEEIYEGDILKYTRFGWRCFGHSKDNTDLVTYYEVRWSDEYSAFRVESKHMSGSLIFDDSRAKRNEVEVIGNIYENPELLEKVNV